jgi:hypothetical protein
MHDKEKQIALTTDDVEKIYKLVTETPFGMDVQIAALKNPKTPLRVLEWLYKNAHDYDVKGMIAQHPNTSDDMLRTMLGEYISSIGERGDFYYPSWAAFRALLSLLERKGISLLTKQPEADTDPDVRRESARTTDDVNSHTAVNGIVEDASKRHTSRSGANMKCPICNAPVNVDSVECPYCHKRL